MWLNTSLQSDTEDLLLSVALNRRVDFFRLWNQCQNHEEDFLGLSFGRKFLRVLARLSHLEEEQVEPLPEGIQFISAFHPAYPEVFRELPQPPVGLFFQGQMEDLQTLTAPRVAVVGSRKPTPYALRLAYRCTSVWARAGWWVISGGAYGIDSEAHRATLDTGGRTVCILGSGLNHWYPRTNERLFKSILDKKGCLVSEYPPTMEPKPYHFPERNRLIAAWSQTLFLVQAHEKSGSLSTARTALDLGREVIVLRPPLGVAGFEGSNSLIEAGAKVLTDPTEIEEVYLPKI